MQIHLRNEIDLDGQKEVIDQTYWVDLTEKNGFSYFIFVNEEKERVVIKCNDQELIMTRFSSPKSILRFHREVEALVTISTPMGVQHLMTETSKFVFDKSNRSIQLNYVLKQPDLETQDIFAKYQLELTWF
ncbi:DUF1934 domain-containing protein [Streptococcus dentiloxodontae]